MTNKLNFTQARIKDLPTPATGRTDYIDLAQPKLSCRVSSTGNKSFAIMKRVNGKLKRITIGRFPDIGVIDARRQAQQILVDLNSGIDVVAEKRKKKAQTLTLSEVFTMYLERDLKPTTVRDYRHRIYHDLADWADMPVGNITADMVMKKQKQLSKTGKATANAAMRVLRLTLRYAEASEIIATSPTNILSKTRLWHKNKRRKRTIPSSELQVWYQTVEALPNEKAKVYLLMLLYMGFRSTEALTLEWENIDLERQTITALNTKNSTDHNIPIPTPLLPYIRSLKQLTGTSKWVFSGEKSHNTGKPMSLPAKPIAAVIKATGIEFSSHDLRRTFATIAEAVGLPITMIKRLLNHVTTNDVTGGYIVTEEETLREAINKVAGYIQARVSKKDNVVKLHA